MKAVIIGDISQHSTDMISAFVLGYNDSLAIYNPNNLSPISITDCYLFGSYDTYSGMIYAETYNIPLAIRSTSGASSLYNSFLTDSNFSDFYPNVILFMPAGANTVGEIYSNPIIKNMCITGAGDTANETADDVEFIAPDPVYSDPQDYSSFSNPYIAAQILFIAETLNCSIWEARQRARETGSKNGIFHATDGYGFIDVKKAIEYTYKIYEPIPKIKMLVTKEYKPFFTKDIPDNFLNPIERNGKNISEPFKYNPFFLDK